MVCITNHTYNPRRQHHNPIALGPHTVVTKKSLSGSTNRRAIMRPSGTPFNTCKPVATSVTTSMYLLIHTGLRSEMVYELTWKRVLSLFSLVQRSQSKQVPSHLHLRSSCCQTQKWQHTPPASLHVTIFEESPPRLPL